MIVIDNQIMVKVSVGEYTDFINSMDLIEFKYIEQCGLVLPYLYICFNTYNMDLLQYLNEGNIINVSFGRTELEKVDKQFKLTDVSHNTTLDSAVIKLEALLYIPAFQYTTRNMLYVDKTSLQLMSEIGSKYFNTVETSTITKTMDKQTWVQPGISDYEFLKKKVWLHSYINEDTFILAALTNDTLYFKDAKNCLKQDKAWVFIPTGMENDSGKTINYATYSCRNSFGFTNNMIGRGLINNTFNFETGTYTQTTSKLKNLLVSQSNNINFNEKDCKNNKFTYITSLQSNNYTKAYDQNVRNLIMFSNFNVFISFSGQYKQIKLLEPAMVLPIVPDVAATGAFFIDRICYQIIDKRLWINTTLTKEAPSAVKGTDLS